MSSGGDELAPDAAFGEEPGRPYRRSLRLQNYDYRSTGAYFITVCAQDRACLFGRIDGFDLTLSDAGAMLIEQWQQMPSRFPSIRLDAFVIMPNHLHGIVILTQEESDKDRPLVGAPLVGARANDDRPLVPYTDPPPPFAAAPATSSTNGRLPTIGDVIGAFKSQTTLAYGHGVRHLGWPPFRGRLWQRNYYEQVIRNEASLQRIREYIAHNPARWAEDRENPAR